MTTSLVLAYLESHGGRPMVDAALAHAAMTDREGELRDEGTWHDFTTKIRLFEAAEAVTGDPEVCRHMGASALELNIAPPLKLALRAFGSPKLVYANVARANTRFSWSHKMELVELDASRARLQWVDISGEGFHRLDCDYNRGLLACIPQLFGLRPAHISHPQCALKGAERCVYDARWETRARRLTRLFGGRGAERRRHAATASEEHQVAEELRASLRDLVSALDLDEVLAKVVNHAHVAAGGREFLILLRGDGGALHVRARSNVPPHVAEAAEHWANARPHVGTTTVVLDDLVDAPELDAVAAEAVGSLCSAPLVLRGESLGILLALGAGRDAFFPKDIGLLETYAAQAAIAVHNARLVGRLETLASRDPLTGLLNHREFHETLEREIDRARRRDGRFGLLMLDVDRFKELNDERGHVAGDAALREIAGAIVDSCRTGDVAFRIGGDEFAVVLADANAEDLHHVGRRLRSAVAERGLGVGLSYGSAAWPADASTKEALLLRADGRLYSSKPSGRDRRAAVPPGGVAGAASAARPTLIQQVLRVARTTLGLELAALMEVKGGHHVFRTVDGDAASFHVDVGHALPVHETVVQRLTDVGRECELVDPSTDEHLRDMRVVRQDGMRAFVSVPIRLSCGRLFGHIGCVSRSPRGPLAATERELLGLLAESVARELQRDEQAEEAAMTGVHALLAALEARDDYTGQHSESVVELASLVARSLGLSARETRSVEHVALLHDVGKVGIPDHVLQKRGPLDAEEWKLMRRHPVIGERIVAAIPPLAHLASAIRAEHERWDGRGYPDGLHGVQIPIASRIVFACDAWHAMTSDRPYRRAMPLADARAELMANAGSQFDPEVVETLLAALGDGVLDRAEPLDLDPDHVA
ncbi:MAG TPA: diguanylate cyclase [Solirubrobacteraceae bacterium]|nr:diguanylate cyclase [Solirubrobacteraceae bacterium]